MRIITDSAADFEPEELKRLDVTCVPLSVNLGGREYQEIFDLSKEGFYALLEETGQLPRTSQPSPQAFLSVLREARDAGEEAVVITLSSALSGTCQCAQLVKGMLDYDSCYIVDSLTATAGERILVERAAALRDVGGSGKEIAGELEALRSRISLYACMDTLKYLHRGGRLSGTSYVIGSLASIKPILHVTQDGRPEIPAKALGVRRGLRWLCTRLEAQPPGPAYSPYVMYTHSRENGELLAAALRRQGISIPESHLVNVGAVIGSHIGPNAFGVAYVAR